MIKDDPAFPMIFNDCPSQSYTGLTIRQYYAAQVIASFINDIQTTPIHMAKRAFEIADAMIRFEEAE